MQQRYFYCPKCGGSLKYRLENNRPRLTCVACGYIFYENPVVGVAVIIVNDQRQILLGRRKGGPYHDLWCMPCGYVEYDEDVYEAAQREFKEETNLDVALERVFTVQSNFHDPEKHTVGIWFWGRVLGGLLQAGDDLAEVGYFNLTDLPALAFPTDQVVVDMLRRELR